MKNKKPRKVISRISSTQRLEEILAETEKELESIQPQIDRLEKQLEKLKSLKLAKQKLITLKLSVKSILSNFSGNSLASISEVLPLPESEVRNIKLSTSHALPSISRLKIAPAATTPVRKPSPMPQQAKPAFEGSFLPEQAFAEVDGILRRKQSINYELFRAVVFAGGVAHTEAIRQFLVENNVTQPGSGESFTAVPLSDISSRINYLVRKGVVEPDGRGNFASRLGWRPADESVAAHGDTEAGDDKN